MTVLDRHIDTTPGICGGRPRIAGRRITVQNVADWHERQGLSVDEIATAHDLSLGDIHAALAYYHDHRSEIDAEAASDAAFVESLRSSA